jgi:hypothetical protein
MATSAAKKVHHDVLKKISLSHKRHPLKLYSIKCLNFSELLRYCQKAVTKSVDLKRILVDEVLHPRDF